MNKFKTAGREVQMMRCQIPPLIGPKVDNAFVFRDRGWKAHLNEEASGVIVSVPDNKGGTTEHFVFGANIQSIRLEPLIEEEVKPTSATPDPIRRGPGRPASQAV